MATFWAEQVVASKRCAVSPVANSVLNLQMVALDPSSCEEGDCASVFVESVNGNGNKRKNLLCTLSKKSNVLQVNVNLIFSANVVTLSVVGQGTVHFTGFFQLVPDELSAMTTGAGAAAPKATLGGREVLDYDDDDDDDDEQDGMGGSVAAAAAPKKEAARKFSSFQPGKAKKKKKTKQ